jgi:hypothetical protein
MCTHTHRHTHKFLPGHTFPRIDYLGHSQVRGRAKDQMRGTHNTRYTAAGSESWIEAMLPTSVSPQLLSSVVGSLCLSDCCC